MAFSALLAICAGNSPVPGEFPAQRPVTRSFVVPFDLRLNQRLRQSWGWWFETLSRPLWRHCNTQTGISRLSSRNVCPWSRVAVQWTGLVTRVCGACIFQGGSHGGQLCQTRRPFQYNEAILQIWDVITITRSWGHLILIMINIKKIWRWPHFRIGLSTPEYVVSTLNCNPVKADSMLAPSQWETSLQSNTVSHWLGANLESALPVSQRICRLEINPRSLLWFTTLCTWCPYASANTSVPCAEIRMWHRWNKMVRCLVRYFFREVNGFPVG